MSFRAWNPVDGHPNPTATRTNEFHVITGELTSKVDRLWDTMWSGGISNPLTVIEQLTYLLFIGRLDELLRTPRHVTDLHSGGPDGVFADRSRVVSGLFGAPRSLHANLTVPQERAG